MLRVHKYPTQDVADDPESDGHATSLRNLRTPTPDPEDDDTDPLSPRAGRYSDKFIHVDPDTNTLTLKHYLVLKPTRRIHIPDILNITSASNVHWIGVKLEGLSITGIIWALDLSRSLAASKRKNGYVIKVKGDRFRVGFSVEHPRRFMQALEYLCPNLTTSTRREGADGV